MKLITSLQGHGFFIKNNSLYSKKYVFFSFRFSSVPKQQSAQTIYQGWSIPDQIQHPPPAISNGVIPETFQVRFLKGLKIFFNARPLHPRLSDACSIRQNLPSFLNIAPNSKVYSSRILPSRSAVPYRKDEIKEIRKRGKMGYVINHEFDILNGPVFLG